MKNCEILFFLLLFLQKINFTASNSLNEHGTVRFGDRLVGEDQCVKFFELLAEQIKE